MAKYRRVWLKSGKTGSLRTTAQMGQIGKAIDQFGTYSECEYTYEVESAQGTKSFSITVEPVWKFVLNKSIALFKVTFSAGYAKYYEEVWDID